MSNTPRKLSFFWTQIPLDICRLLIISEGLNPEDQIISVDTFWLGLDRFIAGLLDLLLVTVKLATHLDDAADPLLVVGDPGVPGGNSFSTSHPSRDDPNESSSVLVLLVFCCERTPSISPAGSTEYSILVDTLRTEQSFQAQREGSATIFLHFFMVGSVLLEVLLAFLVADNGDVGL